MHTAHTHILIHSPAPSMHQLSRCCANWLDVLLKIVSVLSPCLPSEKIVPFQRRVPAGRQQEVSHNEGRRGARGHGGWGRGLRCDSLYASCPRAPLKTVVSTAEEHHNIIVVVVFVCGRNAGERRGSRDQSRSSAPALLSGVFPARVAVRFIT